MFDIKKTNMVIIVFFQTLLSFLLPGHSRLRNQITEVLDLDLIKQEAENGALDISKLASFIIRMMGTLCAPARDEEIKKLKDIHEIVPLFRYGNKFYESCCESLQLFQACT